MNTGDYRLLSQRAARERLGGVSDMTFHRWRQKGILPAPVRINGRNYWPERVVVLLATEGSKNAIGATSDSSTAA